MWIGPVYTDPQGKVDVRLKLKRRQGDWVPREFPPYGRIELRTTKKGRPQWIPTQTRDVQRTGLPEVPSVE